MRTFFRLTKSWHAYRGRARAHRGYVASRSHGHTGGALEFAPAYPGAFDRAQDRFPDAVTEHRAIDQTHGQHAQGPDDRLPLEQAGKRGEDYVHRQERDNEWQHRPPRAEWQRCNQEQIHHGRNGHKNDLEKPNARQTEPSKRAIVPVEHHVAVFPETLQRAVGPAETLSRQCAHTFRRFCPRDCVGHINDPLSVSVQRKRQISVFSERLQTQPACFIDRVFANGADRARYDGDAFPAIVSPPIQIETAGVFQGLTTRDEGAQITDLRVTRYRADPSISERLE